MILYHLDRSKTLQSGMPINPVGIEEVPKELKELEFFSQFEHGLSNHGLRYLSPVCSTRPYARNNYGEIFYSRASVCEQIDDANMHILEFGVEMVRRAYFPQYPSRFESLFAVRNIQDFHSWPELCKLEEVQHMNIVEIDVPDETRCFDAAWLRGGLTHGTSGNRYYIAYSSALCFELAYKYWSKIPSDAPRWEYLLPLPIDGTRVNRSAIRL